MTDFHETWHGRYDTGGHLNDLPVSFAKSLLKTWRRGGGGEFVKRHVLHDSEEIHTKTCLKVRNFCAVKIRLQRNKCHADDNARVSVNSESERRHLKQHPKNQQCSGSATLSKDLNLQDWC